MEKIVTYRFGKNKAEVKVSYGEPDQKDARIKDDCLWLEWKTQEGKKLGIGMRHDEALLIAEMLVEAVRVTADGYRVSHPIKTYRIKKRPLTP